MGVTMPAHCKPPLLSEVCLGGPEAPPSDCWPRICGSRFYTQSPERYLHTDLSELPISPLGFYLTKCAFLIIIIKKKSVSEACGLTLEQYVHPSAQFLMCHLPAHIPAPKRQAQPLFSSFSALHTPTASPRLGTPSLACKP